jgi:DNA-binding NarL/FixJ family response regulator
VAIDAQFSQWSLSTAEREVALLLVKGLSTKEIATVRATSERTVREQARAIYAKAGLAGRAALAAYFLEDLLPPR